MASRARSSERSGFLLACNAPPSRSGSAPRGGKADGLDTGKERSFTDTGIPDRAPRRWLRSALSPQSRLGQVVGLRSMDARDVGSRSILETVRHRPALVFCTASGTKEIISVIHFVTLRADRC